MRIVTFGPNPYLLTANGKLHSWIIKKFHEEGHQLASIVHSYDVSFFVPEEKNGHTFFCYQYKDQKIPVFPYKKSNENQESESVQIFELLEKLQPDLVISIDNYEKTSLMQAVKMFLPDKFKWLAILLNDSLPINEQERSVVEYADAILCTNQFTYNHIKEFYDHPYMDWKYIGADLSAFSFQEKSNSFRLFGAPKNTFKDCPATMIEACKRVSENIPLKLNLHINSDPGFYNLNILQERFDPESSFLELPDRYVSIQDGYSDTEFNQSLSHCSAFLSTSATSATSMGVFEALAAGCLPIVCDQGSDSEIIKLLQESLKNNINFIYSSLPLLMGGEKYIYIPVSKGLENKIKEINEIIQNKDRYGEILKGILKFIKGFDNTNFLNKVNELIETTMNSEKILAV